MTGLGGGGHGVRPELLSFGVYSVFGVGSSDLIEHTGDSEVESSIGTGEVSPSIVGRYRSSPPSRERLIGR